MLKNIKRRLFSWFLDRYKKSKRRKSVTDINEALELAKKAISTNKYAFLITNNGSNSPSARLVEPVVNYEEMTFWIGTNPSLRKIEEIKENPAVTLAFGNEKNDSNVVIQGIANVENNPDFARQHWKAYWRLFFPDGPESADFILIRIEWQSIEVLDFSRNIIPEPFGLKPLKIMRHQINGEQKQSREEA